MTSIPSMLHHNDDAKRHRMVVLGLLAFSSIVQLLVIARATVPAPDAVRFVGFAQSIEREGLLPTLARESEQPLFPAWLWAVHAAGQRTLGPSAVTWAGSAQFAAAVPLVLALVPLYLVMLRLVGSTAAAAGGLLFCVLPEVARLGADGISDTTHLLFFCVALWAVVEYLSRFATQQPVSHAEKARPPLWLLLAGVAAGMALLARAEVLVLVASLGGAMLLFQFHPAWRQSWASLAASAGCLLLGAALVWGPLLAATGSTTPQSAVARFLGRPATASTDAPEAAEIAAGWQLEDGRAAAFDIKDRSTSIRRRGLGTAIFRFVEHLADATGYWVGVLALFGAWRLGRVRTAAVDRLLQVFFVLFSLAVIGTSATEGYLAPRHLLPLVVVSIGAAGYGARQVGLCVARRKAGQVSGLPETRQARCLPHVRRRWVWAVAIVAAAACLPQTLLRVHHSRLGHRMAAEWLTGSESAPGAVLDTQGLTGLYGRRPTYPYQEAPVVLHDPQLAYVVLEQRELDRDSRRGRTIQWLVSAAGEKVAEFPPPAMRRTNHRRVLVYRWSPEHFDLPLKEPSNPQTDAHVAFDSRIRR